MVKNSFSYASTKASQPTVKPVKNDHSQEDHILAFKTNYHFMQNAPRASLSCHLSLKSLIFLFFGPHFTQDLLYT